MTIIVSQSGATVTAQNVIQDAYERCNLLSPGETLSPDDAAFGLRRLNLLVDEMSAVERFLFKDSLTSVAQTGNITLGAGNWAALSPSDEIISATADGFLMEPITMAQYNELQSPTSSGTPNVWAQDGLSTVYLYPSPTGQTIKLQTRSGVSSFANAETEYTVPHGYKAYLGAALAVRVAPTLLGRLPPELIRAETQTRAGISRLQPKIVDIDSYSQQTAHRSILNG